MADIEIEINGQKLTAKPNQTVIQVADAAGIYIPRFCYHKHLSIPANCRMCLVEVEKFPKTLPACATPVTQGMKVFTQSQKTLAAQRAVMEFLLINHPLDCPICDQGGECELQDLSMGYGTPWSHYKESKRSIADQNLGPLIATEMTRCIACTRCVRFGEEIAGLRELGATYRGENTEIGTYIQHAIKSEVSGNIIDICPVGALTSKPFRFRARAWELDQAQSISPHDCLGSPLRIHRRYGTVLRVVAQENADINQTWISDRDRFSYAGLYHADRLEEPMVKQDGKWQAVEWKVAFERVAAGLQETLTEYGADKLGALASPNATLEEFYLLQKMVRGLGSSHVDHRLRAMDMQDQAAMPMFPGLDMSIAELEQCDAILLIGSHLQKEQPLAAIRVRKASQKGAAILAVNPLDYRFTFTVNAKKIIAPHFMPDALAAIVRALDPDSLPEWGNIVVDEETKAIAQQLKNKQKSCVLLGALAMHDASASRIRYLAQTIATLSGAKLGFLTEGANAAGAWLAGAVPHRHPAGCELNHVGLDAYQMLHKPRKAYILLNVEPDLDCVNASLAIEALKQAKCVVALSMYRNAVLEEQADVILPIAAFTETAGTFINAAGEWQSFVGVAKAFASSRPAWKVLRVMANFLHLAGFDYESAEEVKHEVKALVAKTSSKITTFTFPALNKKEVEGHFISRIGEIPIYAIDSLVRRSTPLQDTQSIIEGEMAVVRLHPKTAHHLQLQAGDVVKVKQHVAEMQLPVMIDERVAEDAVWIMGGIHATRALGDLFGKVEILKV